MNLPIAIAEIVKQILTPRETPSEVVIEDCKYTSIKKGVYRDGGSQYLDFCRDGIQYRIDFWMNGVTEVTAQGVKEQLEYRLPQFFKQQKKGRMSPQSIGIMLEQLVNTDVDVNVYLTSKNTNLQREYVWGKQGISEYGDEWHYPRQLIESIFNHSPIGRFIFNRVWKETTCITQIIDGKQRLKALQDFIDNKFGVLRNGEEFLFKDLPFHIQSKFLNVSADVLMFDGETPLTEAELIDIFVSTNFAGVAQDVAHLHKLL